MNQTVESLPQYLKRYCVEQPGDKYTARDQAAWRYIMRQSRAYFKDNAVPIYLDGLSKTGITLDRIPSIGEMDQKLRRLGWGAVPVCGFIPPAAFLDFQARRVLPIASDMRSAEHIAYTPAPDIVHEAAGHAPIIADREYSEYLTMYAAMAQKAIFSQADLDLYEAIRTLSDAKENPDSTKDVIAAAEAALQRASDAVTFVSEANKVARMNWWTVEYGLLGSLTAPKIYGAGLLSSVSESQACLTAKVKKLRLTVGCVDTSYNITEPQPQLFVAEDLTHLKQVLKEFEATLAFARGGVYGLKEAQHGRTVTTTVLETGVQLSGRVESFEATADGTVEFVRFSGPVQLAYAGSELAGQGVAQHPTGFSTPLGRFLPYADKRPGHLTDAELEGAGVVRGRRGKLVLTNGFTVEGDVAEILRRDGRLLLIKWRDCRVTRGGQTYFQPDWGDFDMGVGDSVVSVFGGPADREHYGSQDVGTASTTPGRTSPFTTDELAAFAAYTKVRALRGELKASPEKAAPQVAALMEEAAKRFPAEWLLRLETLELAQLAQKTAADPALAHRSAELTAELARQAESQGGEIPWLVRQGTALAATPD